MKIHSLLCTLGILLGGMTVGNSTTVGFAQIGGSNAGVPRNLASNATEDGNGFTVADGITPNITVYWDSRKGPNDWQVHHSNFFNELENLVVGAIWDKDSDAPSIGQLDYGEADILFMPDQGFAVTINSFDFAHTSETEGTTIWEVSIQDSLGVNAWFQSITFTNGQAFTIAPNFVGAIDEAYTLVFHRVSETYGSNGRHGIDNLSFGQITTAIPEPGTIALGLVGAGMLLALRRRK